MPLFLPLAVPPARSEQFATAFFNTPPLSGSAVPASPLLRPVRGWLKVPLAQDPPSFSLNLRAPLGPSEPCGGVLWRPWEA
eukprot:5870871-Pyramimonas_sp.AAC.1